MNLLSKELSCDIDILFQTKEPVTVIHLLRLIKISFVEFVCHL